MILNSVKRDISYLKTDEDRAKFIYNFLFDKIWTITQNPQNLLPLILPQQIWREVLSQSSLSAPPNHNHKHSSQHSNQKHNRNNLRNHSRKQNL